MRWSIVAGAGDKRGSALWVESETTSLLLDAGCDAGALAKRPDAVLVTHAHRDHVRGLAPLVERFPGIRVVATRGTAEGLRTTLKAEYSEARASALGDIVELRKFRESFEIGDFCVELRRAGHLAGAAMVHVQCGHKAILFSGDFARRDIAGVADGADIEGLVADDLFLECSLAPIRSLDGWGPADAVADAERPGLYICGAYGEFEAVMALRELTPHVSAGWGVDTREALRILADGGQVAVTGKELVTRSAAWELVAALIEQKSAKIWFVNAPPRRSLGDTVLRAPNRSKIAGFGGVRKKCSTGTISLPMHATRPEILQTAQEIAPKRVVLFHNQDDVLFSVARQLTALGQPALVPRPGEFQSVGDPG